MRRLAAVVVLFVCGVVASAQQLGQKMTNQDVIDMVGMGLSDELIIEKIRTSDTTAFDTSVPVLRVLKAAKISDLVVRTMLNPHGDATRGSDAANHTEKTAATTLTTLNEKFSYALGMGYGHAVAAMLKSKSVEVDPKLAIQGFKDGLTGAKTQLTEQEAVAVINEVGGEVRKAEKAKALKPGEANKTEGEAFLDANKRKEGVVALPSGLQYKILKEGTGPNPAVSDTVVCNYRGTLINGTEFDSSFKRGQPATFGVSQVIKGWTEALQLMPVGSKWQLFIPSDLAYGERGSGADIEPGAAVLFEVELLSIQGRQNPAQLSLLSKRGYQSYDHLIVEGEVRNISDAPLKSVFAVVSWYSRDGTFIGADDSLIDYDPLLPGQTSPFKVYTTFNPEKATFKVEFKSLSGSQITVAEESPAKKN
jgi:FKBP-type peptidyl-prolyl cis-trans isomerase FklB